MKSIFATFLLALLPLAACSSVQYGDPTEVETVNVDWGSTDLQQFSAKMVVSLSGDPDLNYMATAGKGDDKRIIVYMGAIRNETKEHIALDAVTDAIRTELMRTNKFRFVADQAGQTEIGDQVRHQNESARVNPEMAKKFGKQLGADVVVYGTLYSIEKKRDRSIESAGTKTEDTYYQFVMNCVNIETGEIIWSERDEIRKTQKTGLFG